MVNLTIEEARARAGSIAVRDYDSCLALDTGDTSFGSTTRVTFESLDGKATFLELAAHKLRSAELNGVTLDNGLLANDRLPLRPVPGTNVLTVDAVMAYSHDGEGLHRSVDPEDGRAYVYAMSFLDAAPRVFACFDQPDLKAQVSVRVKLPPDWSVLGNGRATRDSGEQAGWWTLATTKPLSMYLVTLVAGPFHSLTSEHDGIRLGLHCRQSLTPHLDKDAEELFTVTGECFDEYHRLFGLRYPFGDYNQVFVPEFEGAMENPGCVFLGDDFVFRAQATRSLRSDRATTIAHEMAHMWFGDLVTMRWWNDLWLNESFADYMGHRACVDATSFTDSWLVFALNRKAWGLDADQRSSTHSVAGNGAGDAHSALTNFDGISYAKGAVILRQLNNYLGEEAFVAGITGHLSRHAYGNATLADLVSSWQVASGRDLTAWTDAWLHTSGVDTLSVRQGSTTTILRSNGSPEPVAREHAIKVTSYDVDGNATTVPVLITDFSTDVALDGSAPDTMVLPDSLDETWAKIRLHKTAIDLLPRLLPRIAEPTSRAVIWRALRDALLDARLAPGRYLDIACAVLAHEAEDLVLGRVLTESVSRAGSYFHTPDQLARLEPLCRQLLADCDAGSNRQLLVAQQLLRVSTDADLLRSWLGGHAPQGLLVDTDMRWRVLEQLCALGSADGEEIEQECAADPSSQGALAALRCRAAVPTVEGKRATWTTITTDAEISHSDLYALCGSFFRASQADLVRPYIARYFTEMPGTAAIRIGWVVQASCAMSFPKFAATDDVMAHADSLLARDDLDPFARRAISDKTDDLRRLRASRIAYGDA